MYIYVNVNKIEPRLGWLCVNSDDQTLAVFCTSGVQSNVREKRDELFRALAGGPVNRGRWLASSWTDQCLAKNSLENWELAVLWLLVLNPIAKEETLATKDARQLYWSDSLHQILLCRTLSVSRTLPSRGYFKDCRFSSPKGFISLML